MTRRRRRKHEKRRRHRSQPPWGSHHSLITGAGVTAGAVLGLASPAMATDWVVNNTLGGGDNACVQPTDCTLRDAVYNANLNAGFDTIHFASGLSGTITSNTSVLLDKGSGTLNDQRGQPRPFDIASIPSAIGGNGADIGAVELQAADLAGPPPPAGPPSSGQSPTPAAKKKCKKSKKRAAAAKKCKKAKK